MVLEQFKTPNSRYRRGVVPGSGQGGHLDGTRAPGRQQSEWPVQSPMFLRVFLLLTIPVASWVGGALVERMLGSVLD